MTTESSTPKFSSFRPKPLVTLPPRGEEPKIITTSSIEQTKSKTATDEQEDPTRRRERSHSRDRDRRRHDDRRRKRSYRSHSPDRDKTRRQHGSKRERRDKVPGVVGARDSANPPKDLAIQAWDDDAKPYFIDRRGDRDNVRYRSLLAREVPPHHRSGYGAVVGLSRSTRIDRDHSREGQTMFTDRASHLNSPRQILSGKTAREMAQDSPLTRYAKTKAGDSSPEPFIPLQENRGRTRQLGGGSAQQPLEHEYPVITLREGSNTNPGSLSESSSEDSDLDIESATQPESLPSEADAVKRRNVELIARTRELPNNLENWLALVDHQEAMLKIGGDFSRRLTSSERRNLSDIRLGICESAAKLMPPNSENRIQLLLEGLKEGSNVWDAHKIEQRWQKIVQDHPTNATVASKYLDYVQTNFTRFRFDEVKSAFHKCLQLLDQKRSHGDTLQPMQHSHLGLYVLSRLTRMMQDAGYIELAIATWQACLELTFRGPSPEDVQSNLRRFEDFWESEMPRIGEDGALGWNAESQDSPSQFLPQDYDIPYDLTGSQATGLTVFHELETRHTKACAMPARSMDRRSEQDAYSVVMYPDVEFSLTVGFSLSTVEILRSFLSFCGLPDLAVLESNRQTSDDPYVISTQTKVDGSSVFPVVNACQTTWGLFRDAFDHAEPSIPVDMVRNVLQHASGLDPHFDTDDAIAEYYVAFVQKYCPSKALKSAKTLLKARRSGVRLYNAYALIEDLRGNVDVASHVYATALGLCHATDTSHPPGDILLKRTRAWTSLLRNDRASALQAVAFAGDSDFHKRIESCIENKHYTHAVLATECLALHIYLSHGDDIHKAASAFHETNFLLTSMSLKQEPVHELNLQGLATLIKYHISHSHAFQPALLHDELVQALQAFPNNTILLEVYSLVEARHRVNDRLRALVSDSPLANPGTSIVRWLFSIHIEMKRGLLGGSTAHSIRATFERALEVQEIRHSPCLWHSYLQFEVKQLQTGSDDKQKERVKSVFLRGVRAMPWCKDFMMQGFATEVRAVLGFEECRRVWRVMVEKELRIFVDAGSVFDRHQQGESEVITLPVDEDSDA